MGTLSDKVSSYQCSHQTNRRQTRRTLLVAVMVVAVELFAVQTTLAAYSVVRQSPADHPEGLFSTIQAALDKAGPGDEIDVNAGKYNEDVRISKPGIRMLGREGAEIHGTVRIEASGVSLTNFTVIDDDRCVVAGSEGQGCRIWFNRLIIGTASGVALEVAGAETSGMEIVENQIYNPGGVDPDIDPRGLKYNWRPFERAGTGILIRGKHEGDGRPLRIHHNRISGYHTGLLLDEEDSPAPLKAVIWKNRITANTTGMKILAGGCTIEENEIVRNTATGLISSGKDNLIVGNRIFDSARRGLDVRGARVYNNLIIRNHGGGVLAGGLSQVAHNTFHGNRGALLYTDEGSSVRFVNNLVDHRGVLFRGSGELRRRHNVYANCVGPGREEGSRSGKLAYCNLPADDFRPLPDSIAVDAAAPLAEIGRDADNAGRRIGLAPDAGAYEMGPARAAGRQWWVAPTGSDEAGDGSRSRPFQTVSRAARDAGPGDRIYLQAGVYRGDQAITCAGAQGHPVRIVPAPSVAWARSLVKRFEAKNPLEMAAAKGRKVLIEGSSWKLANSTYLVIEGLEFRDSPHAVIDLRERACHNAIRDCVFINCPPSTPEGQSWHAGITGSGPEANYNLIENNIFDRRPNQDYHHQECDVINPFEGNWNRRWVIRGNRIAGYQKLQLGAGGRPDHSTLGSPPTYHLVENNEFFEMNEAVHIKSSDNIFRHNYIHDLVPGYVREWVGMMNRSGNRNVYDGNLVVDCPYAGILVLDKDNTVVNNVFVRCETGVLVAYREFGATPAENTRVYHNTFINSLRAVQVEPKCSATVYNNIIYSAPDFQPRPPTAPALVAEGSGVFPLEKLDWSLFQRFQYKETGVIHAGHNLYSNAEPGYLRNYEGGHFDVYADPLFADPENGDYRLRPGSPALRAGRSLDVGHDFDGRPRPADAPDLGAFQTHIPSRQ